MLHVQKKEDQRIRRTKEKISVKFMEMRKKYPVEEIRITELCRIAGINRATFYHHYVDIYALSDEIEYMVIRSCLSHLTEEDRGLFFTNPKEFIVHLKASVDQEKTRLEIVSAGRKAIVFSKLEEMIVEFLMDGKDDEELRMKLTYTVGGAMRVLSVYSLTYALDLAHIQEQICRMILKQVSGIECTQEENIG